MKFEVQVGMLCRGQRDAFLFERLEAAGFYLGCVRSDGQELRAIVALVTRLHNAYEVGVYLRQRDRRVRYHCARVVRHRAEQSGCGELCPCRYVIIKL